MNRVLDQVSGQPPSARAARGSRVRSARRPRTRRGTPCTVTTRPPVLLLLLQVDTLAGETKILN